MLSWEHGAQMRMEQYGQPAQRIFWPQAALVRLPDSIPAAPL